MTAFTMKIEMLELRKQKPTEVSQANVTLHKNQLQYLVEFYANEKDEDEAMPIKEGVYNYIDIRINKSSITMIQQQYDEELSLWSVDIFCDGKNPISIWSKRKKDNDIILSTIENWLWPDDTK